jgi:hypothetical protein
VRGLSWAFLAAFLSLAFVQAPVMASPGAGPSAPLGVVLIAEKAHVGVDLTYSGATIYDGDQLKTPENGTLRVRLGSGQMVLRNSSSTTVHSAPNGFSAELESGSIVVSSGEGQTFQVLADGATIRPLHGQPASAQITKISEKELVLTSTRGALEVSMGNEVRTVEPGTSYRMVETADSSPQPQPHPAIALPGAQNHFDLIVITVVAAATGVAIYRALVSDK